MKKRSIPNLMWLILLVFVGLIFISCKNDDDEPDTPAPSPTTLVSDEFKGNVLGSHWQWANEPDQWDINTTRIDYLHFKGLAGANIWCDDNTSRLYQEIASEQDFDVSTLIRGIWGNNASDVAGLVVKSASSGEWVLIKLWMHGDGSGRLEFQTDCNDIISPVPGSESQGGDIEIYLRIRKTGNDYTGYFKMAGGEDWVTIGTTQFSDLFPLQVGIFGGIDSGDGELMVEVDYFRSE
jgi:hypothetical protein